MALQTGSPAINAGDTSAAQGAYDERGYARIVGAGIDIGAYEFGATAGKADLSITGTGTTSVASGGDLAYDLTVTNNSTSARLA